MEGQRTRAYELADITSLIKTKGLLYCPLTHKSLSSLEKREAPADGASVWVDSSISMTWPLVEDARPIKKHVCVH